MMMSADVDDEFAKQGVGDDNIPTFDIETLAEMQEPMFAPAKISEEAKRDRTNSRKTSMGAT
jgi:hypothetical protein